MSIALNAALLLAYLWTFWGFYVLVMGIYRAHLSGRMTPLVTVLSLPFVVVGILMDVVANVFIATLVFAELPREWLVTTRLTRYVRTKEGWRYRVSAWVCDALLDLFDPTGNHC